MINPIQFTASNREKERGRETEREREEEDEEGDQLGISFLLVYYRAFNGPILGLGFEGQGLSERYGELTVGPTRPIK